jgi:two-component system NarL family response regulator
MNTETQIDTTAQRPITVLAVDDHQLLRSGLREALASQPDMHLVAEAANGREAVEKYHAFRPDVTLMDISMPEMSGVEALLAIREHFSGARIIMLSTYSGDVRIMNAIQAGANGFLLKSTLRRDLYDAIRAVHAGQRRIPSDVAMELAQHMGQDALSGREIEVLSQAAEGQSNKRIGMHLLISEETVKAHMKRILSKLGANDRTHAVTIAVKRGILSL